MLCQLTQSLRRAASVRGDALALSCGDRRRTWSEVRARVARLAGAFRAGGLQPGDRIAMLGYNSDRYVEAAYACFWAGAVFVPLNYRLSPQELARVIEDCEPALLLADDAGLESLGAGGADPGAELVYAGERASPKRRRHFETLIAGAEPARDRGRADEDLAAIVYTGGTTGTPKGVQLTHANLYINALVSQAAAPYGPGMIHLYSAPLFHLASLARVFSVTMATGAHRIMPKFDLHRLLEEVAAHRVTSINLVPTMMNRLADSAALDAHDLSSLTDITYGASPVREDTLEKLLKRLPEVRFTQHYGMTELSPVATTLSHLDHRLDPAHRHRLRSAGRPVVTAELEIVDEHGRPRPRGEVGEIVVRGPLVMTGYWRRPEETAAAIRDGWFHTGDAAYMDEEGYVYVVDRLKDMIISGGENIYSGEVEAVLQTHPAVGECAVVGLPDAEWGETVHAVVVAAEGTACSAAELIEHCRSQLATYKCPKSAEIRDTPLPLSPLGKVMKAELRREAAGRRERPPAAGGKQAAPE